MNWTILNEKIDICSAKEKLCSSLLGLVHKNRNWIYWFSALKKCIYTYSVLWMGEELQFSTRNTWVPKKKVRAKQ